MSWTPPKFGWLTALPVAATLAVNVAGAWGIAVARRGARETTERIRRLETASRARSVESALASTRAELAFLVGSPAVRGPDSEGWADAGRHEQVGAALLLFLRGHPEVASVVVLSAQGSPLVEAGRPRGVPGYWVPAAPGGSPRVEETPIAGVFDLPSPGPGPPPRLLASIDGAALLSRASGPESPDALGCTLRDASGVLLAGEAGGSADGTAPADASIHAEGWTAASPWSLRCAAHDELAAALVEPLAARYRATIVLNVAAMGLAVLLGFLALREARRRQSLEDRAREEGRVRELERQLFHAERLSTAGRLAAGMAHEINNPLEGMSNYLRLAQEAIDRAEGPAAGRHLARAQEGLERAAGIVRRVLDHGHRGAVPTTLLDVNEVLERSLDFVRSREEFERIRFQVDLAPGGARVRGSEVMLGQVFLNLLLNACEAQPAGGEVHVRSRRNGSGVCAEIADRGPGVSVADRERIFEPFHSTKQSAGLGLSVCHSIVRQHEGTLAVEAREGGGAVFAVRLPAAEVPDGS